MQLRVTLLVTIRFFVSLFLGIVLFSNNKAYGTIIEATTELLVDQPLKITDYRVCLDCDDTELKIFFGNRETANQPFILKWSEGSKGTALAMHGYSDSPYYVKDPAMTFYQKKLNVVSIRLRGHTHNAEDLQRASYKQWFQDCRLGMKVAETLGGPFALIGFSTGGGLALTPAVLRNIKFIALFSPAINLKLKAALVLKAIEFMKWSEKVTGWGLLNHYINHFRRTIIKGGNADGSSAQVRYSWLMGKALEDLGGVIHNRSEQILNEEKIPVFMALSAEDQTVSFEAAFRFFLRLEGAGTALVFSPNEHPLYDKLAGMKGKDVRFIKTSEEVTHAGVIMREVGFGRPGDINPAYQVIHEALGKFIDKHFICVDEMTREEP